MLDLAWLGRDGTQRAGWGLVVEVRVDQAGEVVVGVDGVQAAGFADREQALDEAVAVVGLGAVACLAPDDRVA